MHIEPPGEPFPRKSVTGRTEPVYLRTLERSDLARTHRWHNDSALYQSLGGAFHFIPLSAEELWLQQRCTYSDKEVNLAICVTQSDEHIGNIYLRGIDWIARTADLQILIGEPAQQSRGYGTSALRQLLSHAFDDLNLRKICLRVLADNVRAIHVYAKAGFQEEGRLQAHVFKDGRYQDFVLMALIRDG